MFKRTNINKINQRAGFSPTQDDEDDDNPYFQKLPSLDFDIRSPAKSESKQSINKPVAIDEEPIKSSKKDKDSSFISNKSSLSKKTEPKKEETITKTPNQTNSKTPSKPLNDPQANSQKNTPIPKKEEAQPKSVEKSQPKPSAQKTKESNLQTPQQNHQKTSSIDKSTPQNAQPQKTPAQDRKEQKTTPAPAPKKDPETQEKKTTSVTKTNQVEVKKKVVVVEQTEKIKRAQAPTAIAKKKEADPLEKKVSSVPQPLKKVPTTIKKKETSALVNEKWKDLNGKIKCQEPHNPWECDKDFFNEIIKNLKINKKSFTDDIFVPALSSLANNPKQVKALYENFNKWVRIPELYKGQTHTIAYSIDPNDIKQGELGNCYFLSALSSLAEKPDRILRLFEDQTINELGCYYVRLCVDGIWRYIVIDDFTPCSSSNKPVFAQPRAEEGIVEFWVLLLEKAWAKIFGSYENIDAGFPEDVFFAVTGAPSEKIETEDPDAWSRLEAADKKNYIMTAACGQDDIKAEKFEKLGLEANHAYSLIGVHNISHPREGKVKLCEIRNPWGWASEEWNGKWSDSYSGWRDIPDVRKSLNCGQDDGRFFMSFDDFKTYFDYVTVCKMHDDYYFVSYPIRCTNTTYSIRTFTLDKPGSFSLTLTQKDERYFRSSPSINYSYSVARLVLGKKDNDGNFEFIDGVSDECKNLTLVADDMEAGDYTVIICFDTPNTKRIFDNVLSYYGSQDITFDRIRYKEDPTLLEKIMALGGKGRVLSSENKPNFEYNCYLCLDEGYIVENYENTSNKEITINKDYSKLDEDRFLVLREDNKKFKVKVNSGDNFTVCTKILNLYDDFDFNELKSFGFKNLD